MRFFTESSAMEAGFRSGVGLAYIVLFFVAIFILSLLAKQKRFISYGIMAPLAFTTYMIPQLMIAIGLPSCNETLRQALLSIPDIVPILLWVLLAAMELLILRESLAYGRTKITPMSIKEATDSLSAGIMYSSENGRILLSNFAMERYCKEITGKALRNGKVFLQDLKEGKILKACEVTSVLGEPVIVLPGAGALSYEEHLVSFEGHPVNLLILADVSESYRKTEKLHRRREELTELGIRLAKVNEEIVDLTTEKEILSAKLRIHDELGSNLLAIKNYCVNGGSEQDYLNITKSLKRNVSFLSSEPELSSQDEYELILETAEALGVEIKIEGTLPQSEPAKQILSVAMHECFTNTLRHAKGDQLYVKIEEDEAGIVAELCNNGEAPIGEIQEKGGLLLLREMTETAGGKMQIRSVPEFSVSIVLPKQF